MASRKERGEEKDRLRGEGPYSERCLCRIRADAEHGHWVSKRNALGPGERAWGRAWGRPGRSEMVGGRTFYWFMHNFKHNDE